MMIANVMDILANHSQDIGVIIGALVGGIMVGIIPPIINGIKVWWSTKKQDDTDSTGHFIGFPPHSDFLAINSRVNDRIHDFLEGYGADRVSVSFLHNGGTWLDNTPIRKITMVFETVEGDRPRKLKDQQGELITMYSDMLWLFERIEPEIVDVATMKPSYFRSVRISLGITHFSLLPLIGDGRKRGMVLVEWNNPANVPSTDSDKVKFGLNFKNLADSLAVDVGWINKGHHIGK